jgi:hypothetical protein
MNILKKTLRKILAPVVQELVEEVMSTRMLAMSRQIGEIEAMTAQILLQLKSEKLSNSDGSGHTGQVTFRQT